MFLSEMLIIIWGAVGGMAIPILTYGRKSIACGIGRNRFLQTHFGVNAVRLLNDFKTLKLQTDRLANL